MTSVVEHRNTALALPGEITDFGVMLPPNMSFEDWQAAAIDAQKFWKTLPWVMGDILAYSARRWPDVWEQACEFTDRSNETLRKYMQTAEKFPPERRKWKVSFTYYQKVAFLPQDEQESLLTQAENGEINTTDLATLLRRAPVFNNQRKIIDVPDTETAEPEDRPVFDSTSAGQAMEAEKAIREKPSFEANDANQECLNIFRAIEKLAPRLRLVDLNTLSRDSLRDAIGTLEELSHMKARHIISARPSEKTTPQPANKEDSPAALSRRSHAQG